MAQVQLVDRMILLTRVWADGRQLLLGMLIAILPVIWWYQFIDTSMAGLRDDKNIDIHKAGFVHKTRESRALA